MSLSDRDKTELAGVLSDVLAAHEAAVCDAIERDMRACIVDLLLQLGPILQEQNGRAIAAMFDKARGKSIENESELLERQEKFKALLRAK